MSRIEEPVSTERRTRRVVSLPCGHLVYVEPEATLLGASGPVLEHQSSCHGRAATPVAAWFVPVPISRRPFDGDAGRPSPFAGVPGA